MKKFISSKNFYLLVYIFGVWESDTESHFSRPRAIPLAKATMRKSIRRFPILSCMGKGLRLVGLLAARALFKKKTTPTRVHLPYLCLKKLY